MTRLLDAPLPVPIDDVLVREAEQRPPLTDFLAGWDSAP